MESDVIEKIHIKHNISCSGDHDQVSLLALTGELPLNNKVSMKKKQQQQHNQGNPSVD